MRDVPRGRRGGVGFPVRHSTVHNRSDACENESDTDRQSAEERLESIHVAPQIVASSEV